MPDHPPFFAPPQAAYLAARAWHLELAQRLAGRLQGLPASERQGTTGRLTRVLRTYEQELDARLNAVARAEGDLAAWGLTVLGLPEAQDETADHDPAALSRFLSECLTHNRPHPGITSPN